MKKVLCVVGTRPEVVKMAPIIAALKAASWARVCVLATAQHRQMLDQVLEVFGIRPDMDLDLMRENQSLTSLTSRLLEHGERFLVDQQPDIVLVQGDTTSAMALALASFYQRIPVGHVEAGLRTGDISQPFPEEANRRFITQVASWHFAPTARARDRLLAEGCHADGVFLTGNTVVDALSHMIRIDTPLEFPADGRHLVLVTAHRRENFGKPLQHICAAIRQLAETRDDVQFLYPVHPNPKVSKVVYEQLGEVSGVTLCEPLSYVAFVAAMKRAYLILTDSGGVQEEASVLACPVLVMRNNTERPEAVEAGTARLVGTQTHAIVQAVKQLLEHPSTHASMLKAESPFGDGHAAGRIVDVLRMWTERS